MDKDIRSRRGKRSQVGPANGKYEGNTSFELDLASDKTPQHNSTRSHREGSTTDKALDTLRDKVHEASKKTYAIAAIVDAKASLSRWRTYVTAKRLRERKNAVDSLDDENEDRRTGGIGLDEIEDSFVRNNVVPSLFGIKTNTKKMSVASNRSLIDYFAKLGRSTNPAEVIDLDFVETLLHSGAQINCTDKHGQSLLHEVARTWHVDVAKFLLEHDADVNLADKYGRTPLHVAAAVDYPQMVYLLIDNKADVNARTKDEDQTPVHFAAKNDACESLKALLSRNCEFDSEVRDYKNRTPLNLAAELDRSESARLLLERKASVGNMDSNGNKILSWMINKMPPVAYDALSQYHSTDRPNRKQCLYLNLLVQDIQNDGITQSPLQVAVNYKQYDLLMHLVFSKLIGEMWIKFARWRAYFHFFLNFVYILLWSILGVLIEYNKRHLYIFPDHWWRIVLLVAAVSLTVWQVVEEIKEYLQSKKRHNNWKKRRTADVTKDLEFCHPRWPEERKFLESELKDLDKMSPKYFKDYWNIFDWVCYTSLFVVIVTHIIDIVAHSEEMARLHISVMAITIILLWLRLMKCARSFSLIGPFIVILGHMITDLFRFAFLYLEFYLPYACAFWMIFGGDRIAYEDRFIENANATITVNGFQTFNAMLFTLFRLTLVDEYQYDDLKKVDPIMTDILVGTWLALSAIVCLNLFIALLSDTFQRVYDNAQANAIMQKAITCLNFWDGMSFNAKKRFINYINTNCAPLQEYYDDDMTEEGEEDMKKVTIQIKEELDDFKELFIQKFYSEKAPEGSNNTNKGCLVTSEQLQSEMGSLRKDMQDLQEAHMEMHTRVTQDMDTIKTLLRRMVSGQGDRLDVGLHGHEDPDIPSTPPATQDRKHRDKSEKRKKRRKQHPDHTLLELDDSGHSVPDGRMVEPVPPVSDERMVDVSYPDFSAGVVPRVISTGRSGTQDPGTDC